ncbi:MAG: hypothetical protein IJ780_05465 [Neisseriaceae bacterium]|nr:hypothetical protein [Neisseriaceae bacterium]
MKAVVENLFDDFKKVPVIVHLGIWTFTFLIACANSVIAQQIFERGYPVVAIFYGLLSALLGSVVMISLYIFTYNRIEYKIDKIKWLQKLSSKEYWDATKQCLLDSDLQIMAGDKNITEQYLARRFEEERQKNADELARLTGKQGEK